MGRLSHLASLLLSPTAAESGYRPSFYGKARRRLQKCGIIEPLEARCLLTVFTNATQLDIPDLSTVTSVISISKPFSIADLNVQLNITHTYDGDLEVALIGPDSTRVALLGKNGSSGNNFTSTVFDDEATAGIGSGSAPFTGTFRPIGSLSAFDGKSISGDWTLEIKDTSAGDVGRLVNWSLDVTSASQTSVTVISHGAALSGSIGSGGPLNELGVTLYDYYASIGNAELQSYNPETGALTLVSGTPDADNRVIVFDWEDESFINDPGYDEAAGDAIFSMLVENDLLNSNYLHLIGHSRGAVVVSEAAQRILQYGFTVNQMTLLDEEPGPNPADAFDDAGGPVAWAGIGFVDNYYGDGTFAPLYGNLQGEPIAGAHNTHLPGQGHSDVRVWYGTTVTNAASTEGFRWRRTTQDQASASVDGARSPLVAPPDIVNGDFEYFANTTFTDNFAGWAFQGGGGDADQIANGPGDHKLLLEPFETTRTHNRLYIPEDARVLEYEVEVPDQDSGDILTVSIGSVVLETIALSQADVPNGTGARFSGPEARHVRIPVNLRNTVQTLTFSVSAPGATNVVGAHVTIDNVSFTNTGGGVSVVEIIDRSGSMAGQKLVDAKSAASLFVQLMNPGDEIGIASFETSAAANFGLAELGSDGTVQQQAINAINGLVEAGNTAIGLGLRVGQTLLNDAITGQRALILMSDGEENEGPGALSIIDSEIPNDVRIFAIAFGTGADQTLMQDIAARRNGLFFFAPSGNDLARIYDEIAAAVSGDIDLTTTTGSIQQDEVLTQSLVIDPSVSQFRVSVNYPGSDLDFELVNPQGTVINHASLAGDPNFQLIEGSTFEVLRVLQPLAGTWQVKIIGVDVTGTAEPYTFTARVAADVRVDLLPLAGPFSVGDTTNLVVDVVDGIPVLGASVLVTLQPPTGTPIAVTLVDDGLHGDGAANDGRYGQSVVFDHGAGNYAISLAVQGTDNSGDPFTRSLSSSVAVTEDNTSPEISVIANVTLPSGTPNTAITFQTNDAETGPASVTLTALSSNLALIPNSGLIITGTGANRTLTLTPISGASGSATITIQAQDPNGSISTRTFTLQVNEPVDAELSLIVPVSTSIRKGRKAALSPLAQILSENATSPSFSGAILRVETIPNGSQHKFGILQLGRGSEKLVQQRGVLKHDGITFGSIAGRKAGNPLRVIFTASATRELAQMVLRQVSVQSKAVGQATLRITLQLASGAPVQSEQTISIASK